MRILIAVENAHDGFALVDYLAARSKQPTEAAYQIITVVEPSDLDDFCTAVYGYDTQHAVLEKRIASAQKVIARLQTYLQNTLAHASSIETNVLIGQAQHVILETAKEWKADEIVMGTHNRHGIDKLLLGSVAETVAYHAPCTVAVIK